MKTWENQYRKNVLAVIFDLEWNVFLGKNSTWKQIRTFPKWGIKNWETEKTALFREIYEEIWLKEDCFEIVYTNPKTFDKEFTKEQIERKIANKWEYYIWKSEKIYFLKFKGWDINLSIEKEFSEYMWVKVEKLQEYIESKELLDLIDLKFLSQLIKKHE